MILGLGKAAELVNQNLLKYNLNMKETRNYLESRLVVKFHIQTKSLFKYK